MSLSPLPTVRRVAILGGNRIPFARSNSAYARASNQEMLTAALQGLIDRYQLSEQRLGEVAAGAVMKHARDFNLVRETVADIGYTRAKYGFDAETCGVMVAIQVSDRLGI